MTGINVIKKNAPSIAHMALPDDVVKDGVDWLAPLQDSNRERRSAERLAKFNEQFKEFNENMAYARQLLDRELRLTAAAFGKAGQMTQALPQNAQATTSTTTAGTPGKPNMAGRMQQHLRAKQQRRLQRRSK